MKQLRYIVLLLILVVLTASAQERGTTRSQGKKPVKLSPTDALEYKLNEMDELYLSKLRKNDYRKAEELLSEMYYLLDLIRGKLDPPPYMPMIMPEADLQNLLIALKKESFEKEQLNVLGVAARYGYFSVDQLIRIIDVFSFSSGKISAVKIVFPRVADKYNSYNLIGAFTFSTDKEELKKVIEKGE